MSGREVTVIGGGIVGCLTACLLRLRGVRVTLLEAGELGREASWAGAGILCPIHPWRYPDAFTRLVEASLARYPELQARLAAESGIDVGWRRSGLLIPFFGDEPHWRPAIDWSERFGWRLERLDGAQAQAAEPVLADGVRRALRWPEVAQLRNPRLLKATRRWMAKLGVDVRDHTPVARIRVDGGGVCGVELEDGGSLACRRLLVAAGSWSDRLLAPLGAALSIRPVKGQIVLLATRPGRVRHIVKHDEVYLVPRDDGRVLVGATMEEVGFRGGNTVAAIHSLLDGVMRMMPGLADCVIERQWMGFRPGSPDGMPFLGAIKGVPGLFVASGHYRNGVALAPITAEAMAALLCDESPPVDLAPFAPQRAVDFSSPLGYRLSTGGK
ncbi:MAG: glycine oxidase ThiO [Zetaproteobacteria bacterium]|nr:MAG: glycine oxidase ThiO [Zetaproteobacteria bacterium]